MTLQEDAIFLSNLEWLVWFARKVKGPRAVVLQKALEQNPFIMGHIFPQLLKHPGEPHTFCIACDRCGEPGSVHLSLLGRDERYSIVPLTERDVER